MYLNYFIYASATDIIASSAAWGEREKKVCACIFEKKCVQILILLHYRSSSSQFEKGGGVVKSSSLIFPYSRPTTLSSVFIGGGGGIMKNQKSMSKLKLYFSWSEW